MGSTQSYEFTNFNKEEVTSETNKKLKQPKKTTWLMQKTFRYLYKRVESYLEKQVLPKLTPIKIEILSKPISIEEIKVSNFYPTKKPHKVQIISQGNITKFIRSRYLNIVPEDG